jgi:DNA-binding GntR family transcriptional regulator
VRATTQLDALLRRQIYEVALHRGSPPLVAELAQAADATAAIVRDALARLAAARIVVLQPVSGEILMAPPFSSVPTSFLVRTARHTAFANCAWDALGISAMMRVAAHIDSACGCCGERLTVETRMDGPPAGTSIIHFSVPARQWWDDIVFT